MRQSVIEIGSWKGRSSWALLESCPGPVYCVDSWQGADDGNNHAYDELAYVDMHKVFMNNVGHFPNLNVVKGISWKVADQTPPAVEMVFIDADHSFAGCYGRHQGVRTQGDQVPAGTRLFLGWCAAGTGCGVQTRRVQQPSRGHLGGEL